MAFKEIVSQLVADAEPLIALIVYVIFVYLHIPLVSMLVGLCALGAAAIAASVYEIFRPAK